MERARYWLTALSLVILLLVVGSVPVVAGEDAPTGAYGPESVTLDSDTVREVAALGEQMQGYLTLNEDGTLALGEVDTATLNATDEYVENYKAALEYVNAAIRQGLFTVDESFQVTWPGEEKGTAGTEAVEGAEPEWTYYPAGSGLYMNFGSSEVQYYLPRYGLSTALSLASYVGRSWISVPYTYQFTYYRVYRFYYQYSFAAYGVWSYVPWYYLVSYTGYYYPTYKIIYFWYPYSRYWYYCWCYW